MSDQERVDDTTKAASCADDSCEVHGRHEARYEDVDTSHLQGLADGCGCAEVWEHTSEDREARRARDRTQRREEGDVEDNGARPDGASVDDEGASADSA